VKRILALHLVLSAMMTGCSSSGGSVSLEGWRSTVEKYIDTQGQGDPNILRSVTWPQSRREFSAIGGELPEQSQDARGVLVGAPLVGNARWYVFVVGIVSRGEVQDIRLMALNSAVSRHVWRSGSADAEALKTYKAYYDKLWRSRFPGRQTAPMQYTTFPKEADAFDLTVNAGAVSATHPPSGAVWELVVDPRVTAGP
jgi:hypothetical protein